MGLLNDLHYLDLFGLRPVYNHFSSPIACGTGGVHFGEQKITIEIGGCNMLFMCFNGARY